MEVTGRASGTGQGENQRLWATRRSASWPAASPRSPTLSGRGLKAAFSPIDDRARAPYAQALVVDWEEVDRRLQIASAFVLTNAERERVGAVEQAAYEANLPEIRAMLEQHHSALEERSFWAKLKAENDGLQFLYSLPGFYGPGGFGSASHAGGLLVLGTVNPKATVTTPFWNNDLAKNVFLGEHFDAVAFAGFVNDDLLAYLSPENQILSSEQYAWVKGLLNKSDASGEE